MDTPSSAAASAPLRVLVVEDSLTIRKYLVRLLVRNGLEVAGEAEDGLRAITLCRTLRPDVVTMDMILPGVSGLAATEQIMAYSPTPILIVSASINRGEVFQTYEALAAGAVDVLDKVKLGETSADWEQRFLAAVRMVARIKVITHPRARLWPARSFQAPEVSPPLSATPLSAAPLSAGPAQEPAPAPPPFSLPHPTTAPGEGQIVRSSPDKVDLIAIGASTGGPAAIAHILSALPADYPLAILVVLHISEMFAFGFAEWLSTLSPIPARYAVDGEPVPIPGKPQVVLAPAGRHLLLEDGYLRLKDGPERNSCRPSIDLLFESMARQPGLRALLCLLTGMGKDGAAGMLAGRRAGFQTVAQDRATSVIFGMPGEAIRMGAASRVLPLQEIAGQLNLAAAATRAQHDDPDGSAPRKEIL